MFRRKFSFSTTPPQVTPQQSLREFLSKMNKGYNRNLEESILKGGFSDLTPKYAHDNSYREQEDCASKDPGLHNYCGENNV